MRDRELIEKGSICEGDFATGVESVVEHRLATSAGELNQCRFFPNNCPVVNGGPQCIPRVAVEIARYTFKERNSVADQLEDFAAQAPFPPEGWFDPTTQEPDEAFHDKEEIVANVGEWATNILGIQAADKASHNHEFHSRSTPGTKLPYRVLQASIYYEESNTWIHECGTTLASAKVYHSVHVRGFSLAGNGSVQVEEHPYCPCCEEKPSTYGTPVYEDEVDREEQAILRRMREQ